MRNPIPALALALAATSASLQAHSTIDESRIRCATSNTVVIGDRYGEVQFTCTGFLNDEVLIFNGLGIPVAQGTIGQLRTHPAVWQVVHHTGEQTSIRFRFWCRPDLDGSSVFVSRAGRLIDMDPIRLR